MKLTILLLLIGLMQVSATVYSQATKFNFKLKQQQVADVLKEIEDNSNFRFFYLREQVDVERKVTVTANNATAEVILEELFEGQDINYKVLENDLILLSPVNGNFSDLLDAQQNKVNGKVTDDTEQALPGVTVVIKGTTNGAVTNVDGEYSFGNISENATLQFSFVGMLSQEIVVGSQTTINVTMIPDEIGIEEIVAIGYGTRKKETLTGAISTVDSKVFESRPVINAVSALQGTTAGMVITSNNSRPGEEGFDITIRGLSSVNGGNSPLVLIDGLQGSLSSLNPDDIETMSVLKDGAAAIYGNQAAGGVNPELIKYLLPRNKPAEFNVF